MVHPAQQRRGLATALLVRLLDALNAGRAETLYSQCHLGNAASLAWHEKNGFQEIPNYFAATHRWHHFAWLADRYEYLGQPDKPPRAATRPTLGSDRRGNRCLG